MSSQFPSMKARMLLKLLGQIGYRTVRQKGTSHRVMRCEGRPQLIFAFHDGVEVPGRVVKKVLIRDAGLTETEAKEILGL